jgi:hypothetical protein
MHEIEVLWLSGLANVFLKAMFSAARHLAHMVDFGSVLLSS